MDFHPRLEQPPKVPESALECAGVDWAMWGLLLSAMYEFVLNGQRFLREFVWDESGMLKALMCHVDKHFTH